MAKEFAFEQAFGKRRAIDLDEGASAAQAGAVDRGGYQFLAGAAGAEDQHGGVAVGQVLDQAVDFLHAVNFADQIVEGLSLLQLAAKRLEFGDVAEYRDQAFHLVHVVPQNARRQQQMQRTAVAVLDRGMMLVDFSPVGQEGAEGLAVGRRRQQVMARFANGFFA